MDEEEIILKAKHLHTIFRNDTNGYTVAKFVTYDANEEDFTATGYFSELNEDVLYKLHGDYVDHPRYGMQFQVAAYEKMMPYADPLFFQLSVSRNRSADSEVHRRSAWRGCHRNHKRKSGGFETDYNVKRKKACLHHSGNHGA